MANFAILEHGRSGNNPSQVTSLYNKKLRLLHYTRMLVCVARSCGTLVGGVNNEVLQLRATQSEPLFS